MNEFEFNQVFSCGEEEEIKKFFNEYGYVIVKDILSEEQVSKTIDELWENEALIGQSKSVDREKPETWEGSNWPSGIYGFINPTNDYKIQTAYENRQNPELVKLFQIILNTEALWVSIGRFGVLRPTKNVKLSSGELVDKPEWKTKESWLHWDQNVWSEPDFCQVQGFVALTDHTIKSGGFACIPGFHKEFKEWGENHPVDTIEGGSTTQVPCFLPSDTPLKERVRAITMPKGACIIWDSRLPHQNYPNDNESFRMVQYIKYSKAESGDVFLKKKTNLVEKLKSGIGGDVFPNVLSLLGMKLVGLVDWNDNDSTRESILQELKKDNLSEKDKQALEYLSIAQNLENNNEPMKAVEYYRKAIRLNPDIENLFRPVD